GAAGRACARPDPSSGLHQVRQAAGELRRPPGPRRTRAMVHRHARDGAGWHILEAMLPPLGTRAPRSSLIDGMLRRLDTGTPWRDPPGRVPGRPRAAASGAGAEAGSGTGSPRRSSEPGSVLGPYPAPAIREASPSRISDRTALGSPCQLLLHRPEVVGGMGDRRERAAERPFVDQGPLPERVEQRLVPGAEPIPELAPLLLVHGRDLPALGPVPRLP